MNPPPATDPLACFRLDGRVAIVTGASSGLGERFARTLDGVGARVAVVARREDRLRKLADDLRDPLVVAADLADPEAVEQVVEAVTSRWGRVDVLVNNAGTTSTVPALEEDPEVFRRVIDINLLAPYRLARAVAKVVIGQTGTCSVVNIASMFGLRASRSIPQASYATSKGGLVNLTRELATQWARQGIRVNALAPGWFRSELTEADLFGTASGDEYMKRYTPMGRGGDPHELDGALLFLASDASSFVTGHVLAVDGGWLAV